MPNRLGVGELHIVGRRTPVLARWQSYVALTKPRIIELLLITTVPTMFVAARHVPSFRLMALTVAGGALAAGGANAMNMVYDRDIDALMERTRNRPLVTGAISLRAATVFAATLEVAAFVLLWSTVNLLSAVLAASATAFYLGVYTMWLKRSSPQNIVIGGAAGAVPVLVGWSAVTGHLGLAPFVMFAIIFLWTPPHFWALAVRYREDYSNARVPMLPSVAELPVVTRRIVAYVVVLWAASLLLAPAAHLNLGYFVAALILGAVFFVYAWALLRDPSPRRAMKLFGFSITYLTALFVAMGIDAIVRIH
ncbi:MAG TPA: heme o synthase [Acidimicrobiales bacterium]|nr:heme o synthase [Acidimicrobiales bacterium]